MKARMLYCVKKIGMGLAVAMLGALLAGTYVSAEEVINAPAANADATPAGAVASTSDTTNNANTVTTDNIGSETINDDDRSAADAELLYFMNSMKIRYALNQVQEDRLGDMFNSAVYYIAYNNMTKSELKTYVASVEGKMETVATTDVTRTTSEYIKVADNWNTPTVSYGQKVTIVLPIINIGTEELNTIVIEPEVTNDVKTWPFVPNQTGYIQTEPFIPGYVNDEHAFANRREFTYTFTVREDVMSGFYPIKFKVSYTRAGVRVENDNAAELTVYVRTIGKPESGVIGGNGNEDKVAKSRIIVTGYEVDKDKIFSGDTFNLTIHVQNTSSDVTVSNVLFKLSASESVSAGSGTSETLVPFLPTSGANSIYVEKIGPKQTTDLNIEISAKSGLSQRSYSLALDMTYDSGTQFDLTDKASISIPVYQQSKFDISTPEVSPASINVGAQSDVMFSIYNTGKTTLYNVQVRFTADSIEDNMAFVGNLASGATGNVDIMLTGVAATMDSGAINVNISYEDEAGVETVVEKTVTLFVNDDSSMLEMDGFREPVIEEEPQADHGKLIRIIIIFAALLVIGGGTFFVVKHIRKKREKAMAEADLLDLQDLEEINEANNSNKDN